MGLVLCSVNWLRFMERVLSSTVTSNLRVKVVAYKRKHRSDTCIWVQIHFQINNKEFHYLYNPKRHGLHLP